MEFTQIEQAANQQLGEEAQQSEPSGAAYELVYLLDTKKPLSCQAFEENGVSKLVFSFPLNANIDSIAEANNLAKAFADLINRKLNG